jgi:lysophospholipase L1-like esterase
MSSPFFPYATPSTPCSVGATALVKVGASKALVLPLPDGCDRIVAKLTADCLISTAAGAIPAVGNLTQNEFVPGVPVPANVETAVIITTPGNNRLLVVSGPANTTGTLVAYNGTVPIRPLVIASSYGNAAGSGATDLGTGATGRTFITYGNRFRVRQAGTIRRARFGIASLSNMTGFYIQVWRETSSNSYDLVGESENLFGRISAGLVNDLELYSPIVAQTGDYIGYKVTTTGTANFVKVLTGLTEADTYYVEGTPGATTAYAWRSQQKVAGTAYAIEAYVTAPKIVGIGDSIEVGHANNWGMAEAVTPANIRTNLACSLPDLIASPRGWSAQNMGIGGQTTAEISARFATDVVALHPDYALINGGVNDISDGNVTKNQFLANWKSMLDQSIAANIRPIVMKILPWTNGTNAQHVIREDWNAALAALVATYPTAILIDASAAVGQFRAGGPAGNLWDIKAGYTADNVHFTTAAYAVMWPVISAALPVY